jgi:hypothetical protein
VGSRSLQRRVTAKHRSKAGRPHVRSRGRSRTVGDVLLCKTSPLCHLHGWARTSTIKLFSLAAFPRRPSAPQAVPGGATDPTTDNRYAKINILKPIRVCFTREWSIAIGSPSTLLSSPQFRVEFTGERKKAHLRSGLPRAGRAAGMSAAPTMGKPTATNGEVKFVTPGTCRPEIAI